jgi:hypothetical protein
MERSWLGERRLRRPAEAIMAHILFERGELNSPMGSLGVATTGIMSVLMFALHRVRDRRRRGEWV